MNINDHLRTSQIIWLIPQGDKISSTCEANIKSIETTKFMLWSDSDRKGKWNEVELMWNEKWRIFLQNKCVDFIMKGLNKSFLKHVVNSEVHFQ